MTAKRSKTLTLDEVKAELAAIARLGQMFIEGDECRKMYTPDSQAFMSGDDLNFDAGVTAPIKKHLLRLEQLCRIPISTTLWRRRPDLPDCGEAHLFGSVRAFDAVKSPPNRGYRPQKMFRELRRVFLEGKPAWKTVDSRPGAELLIDRGLFLPTKETNPNPTVRYFVPIEDSMGEVAAALEVFTIASRE